MLIWYGNTITQWGIEQMSKKTVRITEETHKLLQALQLVEKGSYQEIVEQAIRERYESRRTDIQEVLKIIEK